MALHVKGDFWEQVLIGWLQITDSFILSSSFGPFFLWFLSMSLLPLSCDSPHLIKNIGGLYQYQNITKR
jgi:hypothetical protein